jgi:hypothetical protein
MNRFLNSLSGICCIFILNSCADKIVSECPDDKVSAGLQSNLSSIQQYVFTPSCATAGCHGVVNLQAGLNLSSGYAYSNLVDVTSTENGALKRVTAGNSEQSWLIRKLKGDGTSVMPPTGQLSGAVIDTIAAWINTGAADN